MIPPENCPPDPVCCDSIYGKAKEILELARQALCDCCGAAECEKFEFFVGVGDEPHMGAIDYVGAWMSRVTAAPSTAASSGNQLLPRFRFEYSVKIHETGFPLVDSQGRAPEPGAVDHASKVVLSRVEIVLRHVLNSIRKAGLIKAGSYMAFESLTARPRTTGGVAHVFVVTLEHDWLPAVSTT